MPEKKADTTASTATKAEAKTESASEGGITYEDHGDHLIEIDNRGDDEVRRRLPKSLSDIPVDKATQESVQARADIEEAAAENEGRDPVEVVVPPLEDPDAEPTSVTVTAEGSK